MNNMRILIFTIFTLLVAILVYFYVNSGTIDNQADNRTIDQLREAHAQALLNSEQNSPATAYHSPTSLRPSSQNDFATQLALEEEKKLTDAEINRQANELEQQVLADEKAKVDANLKKMQTPPMTEARLQHIAQALVMATVNDYDEASRLALLDLNRPENVTNGQILCIRRNQSGIIGRVKIARIKNGQAFADPIPESFFGKPVDIRVGDELIVTP